MVSGALSSAPIMQVRPGRLRTNLMAARTFGSMEPKVRAAIKFVRSRPGRTCIIGALDKAPETMAGLSGTRIHA